MWVTVTVAPTVAADAQRALPAAGQVERHDRLAVARRDRVPGAERERRQHRDEAEPRVALGAGEQALEGQRQPVRTTGQRRGRGGLAGGVRRQPRPARASPTAAATARPAGW